MKSQMNSLLTTQPQTDPAPASSHDRRWPSDPRTLDEDAPTRWISLAHSALNQAKMAAPRRASASSGSSLPCCA